MNCEVPRNIRNAILASSVELSHAIDLAVTHSFRAADKELVADAARFISPNFYFGIREVVGRTTLEWGQASQIKTLCLTCSPDGHLRQQDSETEDGQKHPSFSLAVSRPSVGVRAAWFEKRGQFGLTHGKGEIGVCRRTTNGIWSEPDCLEYYKS